MRCSTIRGDFLKQNGRMMSRISFAAGWCGGARGEADQTGIGDDANEHRVALDDCALAAKESHDHWLRQGAGHEDGLHFRNFH